MSNTELEQPIKHKSLVTVKFQRLETQIYDESAVIGKSRIETKQAYNAVISAKQARSLSR